MVDNCATQEFHHQEAVAEDLGNRTVTKSYCEEWEKLFMTPTFLQTLKANGLQGKLRSSCFRSVCWKLYLEVLPENYDEWLVQTRAARDKYDELKTVLVTNPRCSMDGSNLGLNNPLSQETESPWNQFFLDNELRLTIKQDVIRTYPKIEFFHTDQIRCLMVDILFVYAKLKPDIAYRQGMHELLAPLIFVLHCDHQAFEHACELECVGALFCQIMETVEPWYVSKEISPTVKMKSVLTAKPFVKHQELQPSNVIITKLTRIQEYLLKKFDIDLHAHLERMEIAPQIYGIRWVRLLFGREFPMQDLLMVWDAIFADSVSFDLVDYIFLAMLLHISDAMLHSDYPSCLYLLMKYPPVGDVHYFIDKAFYLREPNTCPRPHDYEYQRPHSQPDDTIAGTTRNIAEKAANVMSSSLTSWSNRMKTKHSHLSTSNINRMSKSTSEPMNLITDQSPEYEVPSMAQRRKGSTASLSQIEGINMQGPTPLRSTTSTQSLARPECSPSPIGTTSPFLHFGSIAMRQSLRKTNHQQVEVQEQVLDLQVQLSNLEELCYMCADKMDNHIGELQSEVMQGRVNNMSVDKLLLSLAGLKQVRDILKGTLKPSSVFMDHSASYRDNHGYNHDTMSEPHMTHNGNTIGSVNSLVDRKGQNTFSLELPNSVVISGTTDNPVAGTTCVPTNWKQRQEMTLNSSSGYSPNANGSCGTQYNNGQQSTPNTSSVGHESQPVELIGLGESTRSRSPPHSLVAIPLHADNSSPSQSQQVWSSHSSPTLSCQQSEYKYSWQHPDDSSSIPYDAASIQKESLQSYIPTSNEILSQAERHILHHQQQAEEKQRQQYKQDCKLNSPKINQRLPQTWHQQIKRVDAGASMDPPPRPSQPPLVSRRSADSLYDSNQNSRANPTRQNLQYRESNPINKISDFFRGTFSKF